MEGHGQRIELEELLAISTMTLATTGPDGEPHAAPVYFAADHKLLFYFFSDPQSLHGLDITRDPRAAAAFYPYCFDYQDIRGVQMRGLVRLLQPGDEWDAGWQLYQAKFPFVADLKAIIGRNRLYVFIPRWIRTVDNRRGFGFKQEWEIA